MKSMKKFKNHYLDICTSILSSRKHMCLLLTQFSFLIFFLLYSYFTSAENSVQLEKPILSWNYSSEAMKSLGGSLSCDPAQLKPSATVPNDVNKVRPADIVSIAAMGDSITAGSLSKDYRNETRGYFVKNSFVTGGAESLKTHITLANVLRKFNPKLLGYSTSNGYHPSHSGFNVAQSAKTSRDLSAQARELIIRMKAQNVHNKWKIINIFVGTNDLGTLTCYRYHTKHFIPPPIYKSKLEKSISILKRSLPNTIVSITAMWSSQLTIEAGSIVSTGRRTKCLRGVIPKRDEICAAYRNAAYEIQNEKKFESNQFTVVVQGFMDDIRDAFRSKSGSYDSSFYAHDMFHLSKYGNAILGKFLWNGLLEPVGKKNTKAELNNDDIPLKCPDKDVPYIRTLGNS